MNKLLLALVVVAGLSACASNKLPETDPRKAEVEFSEKNGSIAITFDSAGNWDSIKSTSTYSMLGNGHTSFTDAKNIAKMKAKANISDFLSNQVKNEKTFESLSKAYTDQLMDGDSGSKKEGSEVATKLQTQIKDSSNAILRGVYLSNVESENNVIAVTVTVDRKSIKAAQDIKRAMAVN